MEILDFLTVQNELYPKLLAPVQQKYALTHMELSIMLFLANNPGYDTANDIVKRRHLAKSHVSTSVRALEERGYIRKEYRNGNRRSVHLVLAECAGEIIREGREKQKLFFELLTEGLSDRQIEQFKTTMAAMAENAKKALQED